MASTLTSAPDLRSPPRTRSMKPLLPPPLVIRQKLLPARKVLRTKYSSRVALHRRHYACACKRMSEKFIRARGWLLIICFSWYLRLSIRPRLPHDRGSQSYLQQHLQSLSKLASTVSNLRHTGMDLGVRREERYWPSEIVEIRRTTQDGLLRPGLAKLSRAAGARSVMVLIEA